MAVLSTLHQKKTLQRRWAFILNDDGTMQVQTRRRGTAQDFTVELRNLSPKSARTKSKAWVAWIFGWALVAGWFAAMLCVAIGLHPDPWSGRLIAMAFISIILAPILTKVMQKAAVETYDATIFYNRWNNQAAISVDNNSPDPESAQKFIELLTRQTELAGAARDWRTKSSASTRCGSAGC
jgi:hypothetical protein